MEAAGEELQCQQPKNIKKTMSTAGPLIAVGSFGILRRQTLMISRNGYGEVGLTTACGSVRHKSVRAKHKASV